jgi:hypothetical protein
LSIPRLPGFGDIFFRMSIINWKRDGERRADGSGAHIGTLFNTLDGGVGKASLKTSSSSNTKTEPSATTTSPESQV